MIKFTKVRDVKSPNRGTKESAGIDFFIPFATSDFIYDFVKKNSNSKYKITCHANYIDGNESYNTIDVYPGETFDEVSLYDVLISHVVSRFDYLSDEELQNVKTDFLISIAPHHRILVPSGVKVWIDKKDSALIATNKSGVATKKGLVVGATTIDSDYTGEVHLSVINTTDNYVNVKCGEKLIQFIHTPIILSSLEEVDNDTYNNISTETERGAGGFGSTGLQ